MDGWMDGWNENALFIIFIVDNPSGNWKSPWREAKGSRIETIKRFENLKT